MSRDTIVIPKGGSQTFGVAGLGVSFHSEIETFQLPWSYTPFEIANGERDLSIAVRSRSTLKPAAGRCLYESRAHWRLLDSSPGLSYELCHPPSGEIFARMRVDGDHEHAELAFAEDVWRRLGGDERTRFLLPYPLDQLLLVPPLAARGGMLLHASGAVLEGRALVFAGHSGAGKTTIARLLGTEGLELLGDERLAVVWEEGSFRAYGTPWPGEGEIVSSASYPLGAIYLLNKSAAHAIRDRGSPSLVPEILSRAIVPYHLPETTKRILAILPLIAGHVSVGELSFARAPGLRALLDTAA